MDKTNLSTGCPIIGWGSRGRQGIGTPVFHRNPQAGRSSFTSRSVPGRSSGLVTHVNAAFRSMAAGQLCSIDCSLQHCRSLLYGVHGSRLETPGKKRVAAPITAHVYLSRWSLLPYGVLYGSVSTRLD
jgi:hypothetical protein